MTNIRSYCLYTNSQIEHIKYYLKEPHILPIPYEIPSAYRFNSQTINQSLLLKKTNKKCPVLFYNELFSILKCKELLRHMISLNFSNHFTKKMRLLVEVSCIELKPIQNNDTLLYVQNIIDTNKVAIDKYVKGEVSTNQTLKDCVVTYKRYLANAFYEQVVTFKEYDDINIKKKIFNEVDFDTFCSDNVHEIKQLTTDEEARIQKMIYERLYELENFDLKVENGCKGNGFVIKNDDSILYYFENKIMKLLKEKFDFKLVLLYKNILMAACRNSHLKIHLCDARINENLQFILEPDYIQKLNLNNLLDIYGIFKDTVALKERIIMLTNNRHTTVRHYNQYKNIKVLVYYAERHYDQEICEFLISNGYSNSIIEEIYNVNKEKYFTFKKDEFNFLQTEIKHIIPRKRARHEKFGAEYLINKRLKSAYID
ncbi:hypothetical protein COBT_000970 [Conglomerata obtusa]